MHNRRRVPFSQFDARSLGKRLAVVTVVLGGAFGLPLVANAALPRPTVTHFIVSVKSLYPEGGSFSLSATVAKGTNRTFSVVPTMASFPVSVP